MPCPYRWRVFVGDTDPSAIAGILKSGSRRNSLAMNTTLANTDTIAALATPPGRGSVGIVRISGPAAADIASAILGRLPAARHATHLPFLDEQGEALDQGLALYFPAPHSFTGEDVLELQGHGGPVVMDLLLRRALSLGARPARPGEFSERAFLNDKLDLAQAEAIADLIDAASEQAARASVRSLQGQFSERIHTLVEALTQLRIHVEAAIDFPEEEIDFLADGQIAAQLDALLAQFEPTLAGATQGRLLGEGMHVVIAGRPNAGKSSLLNALAERDSAIVTDIPGTTRDLLREQILIDGMPIHVTDTAGLRDSEDPVEIEGMRRSWQAIEQADRVLLIVDDRDGETDADRELLARLGRHCSHALAVTLVRNKADLSGNPARLTPAGPELEHSSITLSARSGDGLTLLRQHLAECMGLRSGSEGEFMARRRHLDALEQAHDRVRSGQRQLQGQAAGELLAEDLRQAQQILAGITGEFSSDQLLGRIFAGFCIGK